MLGVLALVVVLYETAAFKSLRLPRLLRLACRSDTIEGQEFAHSFVTQKNYILLGTSSLSCLGLANAE